MSSLQRVALQTRLSISRYSGQVLLDEGELVLLVGVGDLLLAVTVGISAFLQGGVVEGTAHIQDAVQPQVSCF